MKRPSNTPNPRLAESADTLWQRYKALCIEGVFCPEGRVVYPVLRVVGLGDFFFTPAIGAHGDLCAPAVSGTGYRVATAAEQREVDAAVNADQAQIVCLSAPGYGSGYRERRVVAVLHAPRGHGFAPAECTAQVLSFLEQVACRLGDDVQVLLQAGYAESAPTYIAGGKSPAQVAGAILSSRRHGAREVARG